MEQSIDLSTYVCRSFKKVAIIQDAISLKKDVYKHIPSLVLNIPSGDGQSFLRFYRPIGRQQISRTITSSSLENVAERVKIGCSDIPSERTIREIGIEKKRKNVQATLMKYVNVVLRYRTGQLEEE